MKIRSVGKIKKNSKSLSKSELQARKDELQNRKDFFKLLQDLKKDKQERWKINVPKKRGKK